MASVSVLAQPPALAPAPPSMYAAAAAPMPVPVPMSAPMSMPAPFVPPPPAQAQAQVQDYFAFARIADDVCLVQGASLPPLLVLAPRTDVLPPFPFPPLPASPPP